MNIQLLHNYKGLPSNYEKLLAGQHDLADELALYLVNNGHAIMLNSKPEIVADTTPSLTDLRARYKELAGKGASPKWDADTLSAKIAELESSESADA